MSYDVPLDFELDGRDWPLRKASRFAEAEGLAWHYQRCGAGPVALLVHGTGASTHSWRDVLPRLAEAFDVVAVDLPGHGFSARPAGTQMSLPALSSALAKLLHRLGVAPELAVGHSAGAAILARMTLDQRIAPRALVGINAALLPLRGVAGRVFSPAARLLAGAPFVPHWVARRAGDPSVVRRLIADMGSTLDRQGIDWYVRLGRSPGHVAAALALLAAWDLRPLERDLPALESPLTLIVGAHDRAIPPADAWRVAARLHDAVVETMANTGHLAHEEQPELATALIVAAARRAGLAAEATAG